MLPEDVEADLHLKDFTKQLLSAGLVSRLNPEGHVNNEFCDDFLRFIDADRECLAARRGAFSTGKSFKVHFSRLGGDLAKALAQRHLADPEVSGTTGLSGWVSVEKRTARLFMAFLAISLSRAKSDDDRGVSYEPVTEDPSYLVVFAPVLPELQRGSETKMFHSSRVPRQEALIRSTLLKRALPGPVGDDLTVSDLVRFRERHDNHERLRQFRRFIEDRLRAVCAEKDRYVQDQMLRLLQKDIDEEIGAISERLSRRWRNVAAALWSVIPSGAGTAVAAATHDPVEAVAQGSLFVQALGRAPGVARGGELLRSPLAFAALAQKEFPNGSNVSQLSAPV